MSEAAIISIYLVVFLRARFFCGQVSFPFSVTLFKNEHSDFTII